MLGLVSLLLVSSGALAASSPSLIYITPHAQIHDGAGCLASSFYGQYGRPLQNLYITRDLDCLMQSANVAESGSMVVLEEEIGNGSERTLVWLQEVEVEERLRELEPSSERLHMQVHGVVNTLNHAAASARLSGGNEQEVMVNGRGDVEILHLQSKSSLISIPTSLLPTIDMYLPRFVVPLVIPSTPLPFANYPIPPEAVHRIQQVLAKLKFNPSIAAILSSLTTTTMKKDALWLTGENADSGIVSRHSFASGSRLAADWLQGEVEKSGAVCEQREFSAGFAPNVICRYPSTMNTTGTTILSAHYDSRGSFGSLRAPGGDDDGSGTTHVLAIARLIKEKRIAFKSNVELVFFAGEEQGLVGSRAYSKQLREAGANVTLHIQADMLAYREPGEPLQLGLPDLIGLPDAAFLVANMSRLYAPELTVGYTSACCSDHQSFHEQGFPATQVFERAGPIADPMYHNSGDLSVRDGYDFAQVLAIAKVTFSTVLEVAGFALVPVESE